MVAISAGLKVKWAQVLFQILIAMVHSPTRQSQGFDVKLSVLLLNMVKANLGESMKLHPQKVLNNKSVHTYMKKNLGVGPVGETSKISGETASEQQSTADSIPSLSNKAEKDVGEKTKLENAAVEKMKNKKEKVVPVVKKQKLKKGGAPPKRKLVVESSDSESTVSLPIEILAVPDDASTAGAPEANLETNKEVVRQSYDASTAVYQDARVECTEKREIEAVTDEGAIVVRSGPEQLAQHPLTSTGKGIFAPVEIREINWAIHFLPKIDPAAKGKEILDAFSQPNPVEDCMLVLKSAWKDVSSRISDFDKWKRVDEHHAYMCIWFLSRELKEIVKQHRALRSLAGLYFLAPEASIVGDATNVDLPQITWIEAHKLMITGATLAQQYKPKILAIEFSTQAEHAQTTAKQPAQQEGQVEEIVRTFEDVKETEAMNSQEHQAQGNEQQAQAEECQAQELNLLHLPFFRNGKDPLEDFDYNDPRCNPLRRPLASRTPSHTTAHQPASCVYLTHFFIASVRNATLLYCLNPRHRLLKWLAV
ncbi:hypothetical protein F511_16927 [Dorcoceras hygrometricum]|uniref:Uncharacterized protein n=1 Tax=Dorcoceras hygrometricum TaxID=472368 RepID=A0A2Z7BY23_9LAMI|nr:hypothetical protein F511_16927 [Dorcoceras hygrometricum]